VNANDDCQNDGNENEEAAHRMLIFGATETRIKPPSESRCCLSMTSNGI